MGGGLIYLIRGSRRGGRPCIRLSYTRSQKKLQANASQTLLDSYFPADNITQSVLYGHWDPCDRAQALECECPLDSLSTKHVAASLFEGHSTQLRGRKGDPWPSGNNLFHRSEDVIQKKGWPNSDWTMHILCSAEMHIMHFHFFRLTERLMQSPPLQIFHCAGDWIESTKLQCDPCW